MSHEIESMAFYGQLPWNGLGTPLEEADLYDWTGACRRAGLDWEVELTPLVTADTQAEVAYRGVRRSTDGRILGVVGPRYVPLQNRDAFAWFQPLLDAGEASLHTAGSLRQGSRVWVLAKLNRDPLVIAIGDEVEKFVLLSHGHDGSLAVRCGFTPIRVICANTLSLAHRADASKLIRLRHSKSLKANLESIRQVMDVANEAFEATAEQYRRLARRGINQADLRKYIRRVLKVDDQASVSPHSMAAIERIIQLAETGRGNDMSAVRGTYWAAYNGLTEWLGTERGRTPRSRLDSLWFGDAARVNRHALYVALDMAA